MRAVVQRVTGARVRVGEETTGEIGPGLVVLVGVSHSDGPPQARWLADKVANLRVFSDAQGKMNLSLLESAGAALVVSQFTLYGDARRGRRPSFIDAAQGSEAEATYEETIRALEGLGVSCARGRFGAMMSVELTNDGPVTILLDSDKQF